MYNERIFSIEEKIFRSLDIYIYIFFLWIHNFIICDVIIDITAY